ncbi:MAG: hypothetical protein BWY85_02464 [Firmicutes bacterium ADurb.Bin506]|nr:MAG: hypothetical protein BWY85_02464 [Firmicutes bacterium ADurb.Bin506]
MNTRPCFRAISRITSRRAGCPNASTASIAFVRSVMACSMRLASMFAVSGSMSTNTGFARSYRIQLLDAIKLNGVVMTSPPSVMPYARVSR